jgi:hypothetical protein
MAAVTWGKDPAETYPFQKLVQFGQKLLGDKEVHVSGGAGQIVFTTQKYPRQSRLVEHPQGRGEVPVDDGHEFGLIPILLVVIRCIHRVCSS